MSRFSLIAIAILGCVVTAWVGSQYQGTDSLALVLVVLITVAFAAGLFELWRRSAAVLRMSERAQKLSSPVQRAELSSSDAELFNLLEAQSKQPGVGFAPLNFAPFAVGLVVLLGLLGTFMGLVDTIAGAQNALGATSDVDSLRAALLAPMHGLTRAFGTSVAGVATSALLGLAQVMVRRDENACVATVGSIHFEVEESGNTELDQLKVLREILVQGGQMHELLDDRLEDKLAERLAKSWSENENQREAREEKFFERVQKTTEGELKNALGRLEESLSSRAAAITKTAEGFVAGLDAHSKGVLKGLGDETKSLVGAVQEATTRAVSQAKTESEEHAGKLDVTTHKILEGFEALQASVSQSEEARANAATSMRDAEKGAVERNQALLGAFEGNAQAQQRWAQESALALKDAGEKAGAAWSENALQAQENVAGVVETFASRLNDVEEKLNAERVKDRAQMEEAFTKLCGVVDEILQGVGQRSERLHEELAKGREQEEIRSEERAKDLAKTLAGFAEQSAEGVATLSEALDDKRVEGEKESNDRLEKLASVIDSRFSTYVDSLRDFEVKLEEVRSLDKSENSEALQKQAQTFANALEATGEAVQKAAGHVGAGGSELEAVAAMFAAAVDEYRTTSEKWLESLSSLAERPVNEKAGPEENAELMGGYLDQTRAAFDESLKIQRQMQQEMFSELKTLREAS